MPIKFKFQATWSSLLVNVIITVFLATLYYFVDLAYANFGLSVPKEYVLLVILLLIATNSLNTLFYLSYILLAVPYRSIDKVDDSASLVSYYIDRLFKYFNPKEYNRVMELERQDFESKFGGKSEWFS